MKHVNFLSAAMPFMAMALTLTSCKQKEQPTNDIIVEKVVEKPTNSIESMPADKRQGKVEWISGAEYTFITERQAEDSLDIITNHDTKYRDNSIRLTVKRSDGSVFFTKKFTKANFAPVIPKQTLDNSVLLGMVLEKVDGNNLRFLVSVGSPDDSDEEFYYVIMKLSNFGQTSAERYVGSDAVQ